MHYPRIFAASDTEPSTANRRSNKACIPCSQKEENIGNEGIQIGNIEHEIRREAYCRKLWVIWANLPTNIL